MTFRPLPKVKKIAKSTKTSKSSKRKSSSRLTSSCYRSEDSLDAVSPIVLISDMVEKLDEESGMIVESTKRDESASSINSINPSPVRYSESCSPLIIEGMMKGDEIPTVKVEEEVQGNGIFSKIFGGFSFFGRKSAPATTLLNIPQRNEAHDVNLEVIHVFPDTYAAIGHEGLMRRRLARLNRASLMGERPSVQDVAKVIRSPYSSVSEMPNERVVLLRRALSPRGHCGDSQDVVMQKASAKPELWVFLPFTYCKDNYASELCDYLHRRCAWPDSRPSSVVGDQEDTPEASGMYDPRETPLADFSPHQLAPNTIDAPLKRYSHIEDSEAYSYLGDSLPISITPAAVGTPIMVEDKRIDPRTTERYDDSENQRPTIFD